MKISESWLRELVETSLTTEQLVSKLTMTGLEVDGVEPCNGDTIIHIDLTPNRADCISVQGIARELKAIADVTFKPVEISPVKATVDNTIPVELFAPQACPHYAGRVIKNINVNASTPDWMKKRLEASGVQPLSPVVDVTNYVMLELGQPMHAFDLAKVQGGIKVRWAENKEKLQLIDGDESIELTDKNLVIADDKVALAIAGAKGGESSKVTESTQQVFLESAYFDPAVVAVSTRKLGIHTDGAYRFSRGVDPELQVDAIERATQLLLDIVGGEAGPVISEKNDEHFPETKTISFRPERANKLLGTDIDEATMLQIFERLGMDVTTGLVWHVVAPSYRFDMALEEDLIEELARIIGYNQLPEVLPSKLGLTPMRAEKQLTANHLREQLVSRAYQEVMTYSFISEDWQCLFSGEGESVKLVNPVSNEMAVMRQSIWPSLVKSLQHNLNRQVDRVRLFELGTAFTTKGEQAILSGLVYGPALPEQWRGEKLNADFYSIKSDLESLFALTKMPGAFSFKKGQHIALHPGQTADIDFNGECAGRLGALHPSIVQYLELPEGVFLFELNLNNLLQATVSKYKPLSKFPSIRRDLAFVVDASVEYEAMLQTIRSVSGELLAEVRLFDVYQGKGIQLGQKSVGFGLILQAFSRTLKEEEVTALLKQLVNAVQDEHGATLRN